MYLLDLALNFIDKLWVFRWGLTVLLTDLFRLLQEIILSKKHQLLLLTL